MIKIQAGAEWTSTDPTARRFLVVLSGIGTVEGQHVGRLAAVQVEPGEELRVNPTEELEIYLTGLPPVELPVVPQDNFEVVDVLGNATQFENPRDQYARTKTERLEQPV
jgi:redox-sensitive bicupin YhaK (pirin superfamily)